MKRWLVLLTVAVLTILIVRKGVAVAFSIKSGALLPTPLKATTARILDVVSEVWKQNGFRATVTSGEDGSHMAQSKHYTGDAIDFRTKDVLNRNTLSAMVNLVRLRLGSDYDVLLESLNQPNEHLHVEYDPK